MLKEELEHFGLIVDNSGENETLVVLIRHCGLDLTTTQQIVDYIRIPVPTAEKKIS